MSRNVYSIIIFSLFTWQFCIFLPAADIALAAKDFEKVAENFESSPGEQLGVKTRGKVQYKAENLRDPFQGYIKKKTSGKAKGAKPQLPAMAVQGVIWGTSLPQAIIDSKVVKVGDTIKGAEIIKIEKGRIEVVYQGWHYTLSSPGASSEIKQEEKTKEGGN